jgi:hypothetical protein
VEYRDGGASRGRIQANHVEGIVFRHA